jgi:hypothetical protein
MQKQRTREIVRKTQRLIWLSIPVLFFPVLALALPQRMAIAPGTYRVQPHSQLSIQAYCVDLTRDTPAPDTVFKHALTPATNADVTIGGSTIPLQTAIDRNELTFTGRNNSFEDFVAAGQKNYSDNPQKLAHFMAWVRTLSPAQRAQIEQTLPGDHTHVVAVNGSGEEATIRVNHAIVLSKNEETLPGLPLDKITVSNGTTSDIQHEIWKKAEAVHKSELAAVGFPVVPNASRDALIASVRKFQESENLAEKDGQIDSGTEQRLTLLANNETALDAINKRPNATYVAAIIQSGLTRPGGKLYCASSGAEQISCDDSVCKLAKSLSDLASNTNATECYFIPERLDANERIKLTASLRSCERGSPESASFLVVDREHAGSLADDPYFGRPLKAIRDNIDKPLLVHLHSGGDYYRKQMTFEYSNNTTEQVDVYGKTKPILSRFIVKIKSAFAGLRGVTTNQLSEIHAADVIAVAIKDMKLDRGQVRFEIGNVQYANHSPSRRARYEFAFTRNEAWAVCLGFRDPDLYCGVSKEHSFGQG